MLKNKLLLSGAILCGIGLFMACRKDIKDIATVQEVEGKAFVKVVHAAPYFRKIFNAPDTFNIYAHNQKINSSIFTYGSAFPSATGNGYQAIDPGTITFDFFTPGTGKPDSAKVSSLSKTLKANNYYSLIVTDSIGSAKDSSQIWLNDDIDVPPVSLYRLRFVHAVMNDTAAKAIDIYSARRNGNIFNGYLPGRSSGFINLSINQQVSDTLIVRRAGTTFELARLNTISFGNQRVYTLLYRGNGDSTPTAKARPRTLTYFVNK